MLAMARMSIRPEPSVVVLALPGPPAERFALAGRPLLPVFGLASASRFDSENSTEFSWRCPVMPPAAPPCAPLPAAPMAANGSAAGAS
jgi:hypothetical protein